ncbi:MAG: hypothetical protein WAW39_30130 [Prosthecobacter sp.]|uniref:hypothetical protein n=1 Tax=Prosthecobacter sp. TaxID=1965333 RepID=UPI003BB15A18
MKTLLMIVTLGVAAFLTSCQAPTVAVPHSAITCNKCNSVYFKSPSVSSAAGDKGFVTLKSSSSMTCPDCENKVIAWIKTGAFTEHTCKTCGGAMSHCTSH